MPKPMWSRVTLTYHDWEGPKPQPGDGLQTRTGRTYEILKVRGRRLDCLVVPPDTRITGQVFYWVWTTPRKRKGRIT